MNSTHLRTPPLGTALIILNGHRIKRIPLCTLTYRGERVINGTAEDGTTLDDYQQSGIEFPSGAIYSKQKDCTYCDINWWRRELWQ